MFTLQDEFAGLDAVSELLRKTTDDAIAEVTVYAQAYEQVLNNLRNA